MKTLIIGLGNPILGDDGVGWKVAEAVKAVISDQSSVEVDCASLGGLSLMERMLGYQRVILVDSMETGQSPEGSVKVFPLAALPNPMEGHSASIHDTSLMNALRAAQAIGESIPKRVDVVAVEAKNVRDFSEELSPAISSAVPAAAQKVLKLLEEELF
ncbi:MAG: hydrogenase maturation protease [Chloroflexi bacterium]|nr:hydrogenase maturation protease [Chloroflexota bacterium]